MLLANIAAAQQVAVNLPEQALLRRHDGPIERRLVSCAQYFLSVVVLIFLQKGFAERAAASGYDVDISTSGALMKSFEAIEDPVARRVLELRFFKTTQRAKYFCTGMLDIAKYSHFALSVPLYTHFTSPIRRYADILVHRQLEAVLQGGSECYVVV
jgi:protein SSD1